MIGDAMLASKVFWGFCVAVLLIGAVLLAVPLLARRRGAAGHGVRPAGRLLDGHRRAARVLAGLGGRAAMIACVAGIVVGSIGGISSTMGVFGLSVLVVVIVGGLDSVLGALVGGLVVGVVEAMAGFYLGGEYKLLATFVLLVLVLLVRPYGLFGTHEIERL
jgi:branched-chain amino acid transport system permease protein